MTSDRKNTHNDTVRSEPDSKRADTKDQALWWANLLTSDPGMKNLKLLAQKSDKFREGADLRQE